jgi:hypothetical protein
MAKIEISILEIPTNSDDFCQHLSVASFIEFKTGDASLLASVLIGDDDVKYDLDILKSFISKWEGIALKEDFVFEVEEEVRERMFDFESQIEDEQMEYEKTIKRCKD